MPLRLPRSLRAQFGANFALTGVIIGGLSASEFLAAREGASLQGEVAEVVGRLRAG